MATIKTAKSKVTSKPKKTSGAGVAEKSKKVATGKSTPTEEQIRKKAEEIYHQRIKRGEHGTAVDDWKKAEKLLKGS
jgi:hypothetical protein